jgi:hypothetical protein
VPPVRTKTWFHTGAFFGEARIAKYLEHEYYSEGDSAEGIAGLTTAQLEAMLLNDTILPSTILLPDGSRIAYDLSGEEKREACHPTGPIPHRSGLQFHSVKRGIQRPLLYAQDLFGSLLYRLCDSPPMLRRPSQRFQNQHVERPLYLLSTVRFSHRRLIGVCRLCQRTSLSGRTESCSNRAFFQG